MQRNARVAFNHVSKHIPVSLTEGLTFAIRTDAAHATGFLQAHLVDKLSSASPFTHHPDLAGRVKTEVHAAYAAWGCSVLEIMAECLDYRKYGIDDAEEKRLNVHFHDARALAREAVEQADKILRDGGHDRRGVPALYISLDSMMEIDRSHTAEIAFSRLFSLRGDQQYDYVPRPGSKPIAEQLEDVRRKAEALQLEHGGPVPIVLIEDNVRHARMLNWLIGKMDGAGIFEHSVLAGITTCFCCAQEEERNLIQHRGHTVPLGIAVDYKHANTDVVTPRDLFFDGLVVQVEDKMARLPGIFMDVEARFKIRPGKAEDFCAQVMEANRQFCDRLERSFGCTVPLSWFVGAEAIAHVTPMAEMMERARGRDDEEVSGVRPVPHMAPHAAPTRH